MVTPIAIAPGVSLWREYFDRPAQTALRDAVYARLIDAPFYRPVMPKTGTPFSVEETNFGTKGWLADVKSYRYVDVHPVTGQIWPDIPLALLALWDAIADYPAPPESALVNLYRPGAKMGLHQDSDELATDAPVVSVSLGDEALFRIGGTTRKGPTKSVKLASGDVLMFGGPARLAFHGIDRIVTGSSTLIPGGGRINLTLRRVTRPMQHK
jgi:alkylated DNA repair protein (DNA oxidative demethylase)